MVEKGVNDTCATCKEAVVPLDHTLAIVCLILNCIPFTSGVGTMVSACAGGEFNGTTLLFGILQFLLAFLIVGWVWSIVHGIWLLDKAKR